MQTKQRARTCRCGFEVESVDEKAVGEMGVMTWPGLEKRMEAFSLSAAADELKMVYVKEGAATLSDAEDTCSVTAGQMVMLTAGEVQWGDIGAGGLTLISTVTELSDVEEADQPAGEEPVKDLTLKEAGLLLGGGLLAGAVASFGFQTFMAPTPM